MAKETANELILNSNFKVVMSNKMVNGKQDELSLWEHELFRILISQIAYADTELKEYTISVRKLAEFLNLSSSTLYANIENVCKRIMKSFIYVKPQNNNSEFEMIHWINSIHYNKGNLTARLNDEVKPFLFAQRKDYTQYELQRVIGLKSIYSIRLYEILVSKYRILNENAVVNITLTQLKKMLGCEDKFDRFSSFKEKVIKSSLLEMNNSESCDFTVTVKYVKTGRKVTAFDFIIINKSDKYIPVSNYYDIVKHSFEWDAQWKNPYEKFAL